MLVETLILQSAHRLHLADARQRLTLSLLVRDSRVSDPAQFIRQFVDPDGRQWAVERKTYRTPDDRMEACLVFSGIDIARRIRNFPENWETLSDDDLYRLSLNP